MLYAIFHVFVCSMSCAIVALLSLCLSFLCFGLSVRTWSRPYGLCHCPYTLAHIKGFGSSLLACLCLLASYALFSMSHAWVLLASVLSMLQHNEIMDIWSKPTFVPHEHHLLFVFLLVFLLICLLTFLFLCLPCLPRLTALCLFHMLFASFPSIACLLVSCLCLYMYTHGVTMHEARALFPRLKQKGRGCEHVDISQAAVFSRFRSLAFPIWFCTLLKPLPSFSLSLLDGLY